MTSDIFSYFNMALASWYLKTLLLMILTKVDASSISRFSGSGRSGCSLMMLHKNPNTEASSFSLVVKLSDIARSIFILSCHPAFLLLQLFVLILLDTNLLFPIVNIFIDAVKATFYHNSVHLTFVTAVHGLPKGVQILIYFVSAWSILVASSTCSESPSSLKRDLN